MRTIAALLAAAGLAAMAAGQRLAAADATPATAADPPPACASGMEDLRAQEWEAAAAALTECLDDAALPPDWRPAVLANVGFAYMRAGRNGLALEYLDRADSETGQTIRMPEAFFYLNRAELRRGAGLLPEALSDLEIARSIDDRHPYYLKILAATLLDAGRVEEARDAAQRLARLQGAEAMGMVALARIELRIGTAGAAIGRALEALEIESERAEAHHALCDAYLASGSLDEALAACDRATALDAGQAAAFHSRGRVLAALGRQAEAAAMYEAAIALAPDERRYRDDLATLLSADGTAP